MTDIQAKRLIEKFDLLVKLRLSQLKPSGPYSIQSDEKLIDEFVKPELMHILMDAK